MEYSYQISDDVMIRELGPQYSRGLWYRFTRAVKKWYYML